MKGYPVTAALSSFTTLHDLTIVIAPDSNLFRLESFRHFDAWNIARSVASQGLKQIDIVDLHHSPTEKSPFVDVKYDAEVKDLARKSRVHWRVNLAAPYNLEVSDHLLSPECWQEKQIARLAKSLGERYREPEARNSPKREERESWAEGLLQWAEFHRSRAIECIENERKEMCNSSKLPMLETLGYRDMLVESRTLIRRGSHDSSCDRWFQFTDRDA